MEQCDRVFMGLTEEFKENGIRFTMDSLAKRLGMSKRTLYTIVSSKEGAIDFVIDRTFKDVKFQQHQILEDDKLTTLEKLEKLFNVVPAYVDLLDYRRVREIGTIFPRLYDKVISKIENDWEPTLMLLEQAKEEGVIRDCNPVIIKTLLCEIFERLLNGDILIHNNITYEMALKEMIGIILNGLKVRD